MDNPCLTGDLSKELIRIGTFLRWPGEDSNNVSVKPGPLALAQAGFYFTGVGDEVKCFACNISFKKWEQHNIPNNVHATISPQCPYVISKGVSQKSIIIPEEREYNAILRMLDQLSCKAASLNNQLNYSSSIICDTLKNIYGESMLPDSRRTKTHMNDCRSLSSSPARKSSKETRARGNERGNRTSSQNNIPESSSPLQRNDHVQDVFQDNNPTTLTQQVLDRPQIQRTRSYAHDSRTSRSHSETIANRQNSNPGMDHARFQDSEEARLATYSQWPSIRGSSPREFAQAGFIFLGHPDRVQCVFCNGILRNWNDNDVPMEEHSKHFPLCSFVKEFESSAVSVSKARHQKHKTEPARLSSFQKWPAGKVPTPQELSKAGFFYVGHGDSVKCFFCDGGLRNWESDDDPWREHAKWFPSCGYVKLAKGKAFIESVLQNTNKSDFQTASVDQTSVKSIGSRGQKKVDLREVVARMESEVVKEVLKMDVPRDLVERAISKRLSENGQDFSSSENLLDAVFSLDHNETITRSIEPLKDALGKAESEQGVQDAKAKDDSVRLMEENRQLKEQRQCKICMDEEVCMAFLPCGHLVCCSTCAPALSSCPICRAKVRGTVRTYLS